MNAFTAKCKCQHCNQKIEFTCSQAGESVACPGCGMDTLLFIPPNTTPPNELQFDKKNVAVISAIIGLITVIGFAGVLADHELNEQIHPVVFAVLSICVGVLYFAPSLIGSKKKQFPALLALNLLLGWTFIGWVGALVWALVKEK